MSSCPDCSFSNPPTASFCANCGRELARPPAPHVTAPLEAERRFATILFADLSGFTALSEVLDPEAVRDIINFCFDRLAPIVEIHHGVIDQFVGDAIVALFGAPYAHEDDPAQACRAALAMMDAIEQVNHERGLDLGLHIGINSGTVISGGVGSRGRQQYSVLGDAVNMSARLQDVAERGEIFVGAETVRLTREQFHFVERGAMPFKGKSEPQPVYQLVGARETALAHRIVHTHTPLFGRARELALLQRVTRELQNEVNLLDRRASLDDKGGARLSVVSILGDAGLGKSRLLQEWRAAAQNDADELLFSMAGCAPDGNARAYALLADIARALAPLQNARAENDSLAWLLGVVGAASHVAGEMDASALQAQYVNTLRETLIQLTDTRALVLVCEDAHWADEASCQVLRRALTALPETRVLFCLTLRPDRATPGWKLMEQLEEFPGAGAVRLNLAPLSEQDAQAMVAQLAPGDRPREVEELVLALAEGNPLFVEELMRMLIERGDLKREGDAWLLKRELVALDVPNTLQGVLMARVDQLPPDARQLLQIASVLGREFPLEVLERVALSLRASQVQ